MPLYRRVPRRGFNNARFRDKIVIVNVGTLEERFEGGATVSEHSLRKANLVKGSFDAIKILGEGAVTRSMQLSVHAVSGSARTKIEQAGGTIELRSESKARAA